MTFLVFHVEALISLMKHEWTFYKTLWHKAIPLTIFFFWEGEGGLGLLLLGFIIKLAATIFLLYCKGGGGWGCYFEILQYDCKTICWVFIIFGIKFRTPLTCIDTKVLISSRHTWFGLWHLQYLRKHSEWVLMNDDIWVNELILFWWCQRINGNLKFQSLNIDLHDLMLQQNNFSLPLLLHSSSNTLQGSSMLLLTWDSFWRLLREHLVP